MKRIIAAVLFAAFSGASLAQAFSDGDPYRSAAGASESDNVVQGTAN